MSASEQFIRARDQLLATRADLQAARDTVTWPRPDRFNWVRDYFEPFAQGNAQPGLRVVDDTGRDDPIAFDQLLRRCNQVANFLGQQGVQPGDRVLVMLGNVPALWETTLAAIKLGLVMIPATTLLDGDELRDRLERGRVKAIITDDELTARFKRHGVGAAVQISVGGRSEGWTDYQDSERCSDAFAAMDTRADDLLLLYFTSGTTAQPKLVAHTHVSYPVGHLSTMYWLGLQPGDVHLNLSSPGWAKHAWSNFFAPFNAGATVLAYQYERFDARRLLDILQRCKVTVFCAPPTVWRMLIQQDLSQWQLSLREAVSAGEPLNPEVIQNVRAAWGVTIRDGFGQTETTAQIGNSPGQPLKPGSMGRALPGYHIALLDADGKEAEEGEICLKLSEHPPGLMHGYLDDVQRTAQVRQGGYYHTGDVGWRDADGYITYVGRTDDVFKSSDYRISPFELESVLLEHPSVAEAAVVPSPEPTRLSVPKAYVVLVESVQPSAEVALSILQHTRERVPPYKRIRRLEFAELPKTISGKIRRVELRRHEQLRRQNDQRGELEFWEEEFAEFRRSPTP